MKREPTKHEQEILDEWVEPPKKKPLRSLWGKILFVISLGFWKGN